ncbi:MAG: 8-oxoguanine glycosylase ogg1 [Trichoglossum hirsutum]|nr:MAG: 8-oxoguanine glycosylase ogg1 [Trichoglossum hirsutum]
MTSGRLTEWRKLPVNLSELCINTTLRCGQSFRSCALQGRILSLRQDPTHLHYRAIFPVRPADPPSPTPSASPSLVGSTAEGDDTEDLIRRYFNLNTNLTELYEQWSSADSNFKRKAPKFTGVRILRQDTWEALVGFICSSNNNIIRISQMVEKLCVHYGPLIGHIDSLPFHDFPPASALVDPNVEAHLRQLGFGYRAKYLHRTALMIAEDRPVNWLDQLRNPESPNLGCMAKPAGDMKAGGRKGYREAHEQLLELQGVGPKVADCICLFGLGWGEAVPVDTHVWQIAQRDYNFGKGKHKSLTKVTYDAIGDRFRSLWGKEAGWAHSVLFTADLRAFSDKLTVKAKVEEEEKVLARSEHGETEVEESLKVDVVTGQKVKRKIKEEDEGTILEVGAREGLKKRVRRSARKKE